MASSIVQEVLQEVMADLGPKITKLEDENRALKSQMINLQRQLGKPENSFADDVGSLFGRITQRQAPSRRSAQSSLGKHVNRLERNVYRDLIVLSLSEPLTLVRLRRYVSGFVFVDLKAALDHSFVDYLTFVLRTAADTADLDHVLSYPYEISSWYRRFLFKSRKAVTHPEVAKRLSKLEHAIQLETLGKSQASINKSDAEAASLLIDALKNSDTGIVRLGSILISKRTDADGKTCIAVRNLTEREVLEIENSPELAIERDVSLDLIESR